MGRGREVVLGVAEVRWGVSRRPGLGEEVRPEKNEVPGLCAWVRRFVARLGIVGRTGRRGRRADHGRARPDRPAVSVSRRSLLPGDSAKDPHQPTRRGHGPATCSVFTSAGSGSGRWVHA